MPWQSVLKAWVGRSDALVTKLCAARVQVIRLCEKLADCDAKVSNVPVGLLKFTRSVLRSFQWARDAADRLAFAEILTGAEDFTADMTQACEVLDIDPSSITGPGGVPDRVL